MRKGLCFRGWSFALLALCLTPGAPAQADAPSSPGSAASQGAQISGDPDRPRRHFRVRGAARLSTREAAGIYDRILEELYSGYGAGASEDVPAYRQWPRYNSAPYRSATHGARYVNNYANAIAADYGRYEEAGIFPEGSLLAKDSFSVTRDGLVEAGPLFLMEKMPQGFNHVSGDWRYSMIMPDGELFGETNGRGAEKVEYCIGCHLVKEDQDHLFFVPRELRIR